ncbi:hypothetical protein Ga0100231_024760 [Opitutaceae bacterium TAV4]|nr:hypothetical protein Ga0100231_016905 [Opitutaceae bacterium TAV4]RRJ96964.1 hypothetical protein Ga0100231_024760 [Opitutaceae bacterium TAV4]RRK00932.1 hypothetical protein Ga0100230_024490 [Opitutaceae bacterium TAV3]
MKITRKPLTLFSAFSLVAFSFSPALAAADAGAMSRLVQMLVEQKTLTPEQGQLLVQISEEEKAAVAKEVTQAVQQALKTTPASPGVPPSQVPAGSTVVTTTSSDGTLRVTYVPEVVKRQLREDIKQEVMKQAREENWAAPRSFPEWTSRLRLSGDFRFRYEGDYFPSDNDTSGVFPNFNALNNGSPYDVSKISNPNSFAPQQNVDQDRERLRLRARLALDADLGENFTAGFRIATGNDDSPVSTNQSMASDGLGSKYAIWLDRAFLRYDVPGFTSDKSLTLTVGRFNNPFFSTDLIWDDDLGFDGVLAQARYGIGRSITPFFTIGAFPVYNTDFNFSSNQPQKFKSDDKWLYGGQIGFDWKLTNDLSLKVGAAYYEFTNIEGKLSTPYTPLTSSDAGDTDTRRPSFAQKGNSYMALRNILPAASNNWGTENQWQYFGLATPFRELALTAKLDFKRFDPVHLSLETEFVKNLAYEESAIAAKAVNNRVFLTDDDDDPGLFDGGDMGWLIRLNVGNPVIEKRWDWQASIAYKYIESDAVVDGFTDSDFGLGGTNLKGFILGVSVGLSKHVNGRVRWLSADSVTGPSYSADVFQFDINSRF